MVHFPVRVCFIDVPVVGLLSAATHNIGLSALGFYVGMVICNSLIAVVEQKKEQAFINELKTKISPYIREI